ncbi:uncharacterized protein LOC143144932 [Ptiloglossa arizonensis]|uniref:uncharacterized protein LOC143144932 n=1 Tax=Ptiloglossa arizonensis TaxID=3350558 RepID=UPI003FA000A8
MSVCKQNHEEQRLIKRYVPSRLNHLCKFLLCILIYAFFYARKNNDVKQIMYNTVRTITSSDEASNTDNARDQKNRDRSMRIKRKKSSKYVELKKRQLWKLELAQWLINDLKNNGPAGLIHMEALSNVIGKPIQIWRSVGRFYKTINSGERNMNESSVNVEFHEQEPKCIGHWTLYGNRDPVNVETNLNGCLFEVIAAQTGQSAINLRTKITKYLTNNIKTFTDRIDTFLSSNGKNETPLMIGGARYNGTSPRAARIILDNSQNVFCHKCLYTGHPRGHASDKNATGKQDSVENYSRTTKQMKSGFLSRKDQDTVAHFALSHKKAQNAMRYLNSSSTNEAVTLSASELELQGCHLPKMKEWYRGEEFTNNLDISQVVLVLRHHKDKNNDPNADVFVHTFYPRSS